jgi:hypothetical protein
MLLLPLNLTTSQTLAAGDCTSGGWYYDPFTAYYSGACTITMHSGDFDAYLEVYDYSGNLIASDDDSGGGSDASVSLPRCYAPNQPQRQQGVVINATSYTAGRIGDYTLTVTYSPSVAPAVAAGFGVPVDRSVVSNWERQPPTRRPTRPPKRRP